MRRGVFVVLVAFVGACGGDGVEVSTFRGTGQVGPIEAGATPAGDSTKDDIIGALVIDGDISGLEDCAAADDGFRIFVDETTNFTPDDAKDDLDYFGDATVRVSGRVTKEDDVCTPIADSVSDTGPPPTGKSDGGASVATATPGDQDPSDDATAPPVPTTTPNDRDDEGSITDPEETTSPAPDEE